MGLTLRLNLLTSLVGWSLRMPMHPLFLGQSRWRRPRCPLSLMTTSPLLRMSTLGLRAGTTCVTGPV